MRIDEILFRVLNCDINRMNFHECCQVFHEAEDLTRYYREECRIYASMSLYDQAKNSLANIKYLTVRRTEIRIRKNNLSRDDYEKNRSSGKDVVGLGGTDTVVLDAAINHGS